MKKGKFELLSYFREEYLIFYKSKNNNKQFIAFSIIVIDSIHSVFSKIIHFLNQRLFDSFSYQINKDNKDILLICFKDETQSNIVKCFNIIFEKGLKNGHNHVLKDQKLEKTFLNSIIEPLTPKLSLKESSDSLLVKSDKVEKRLFCYTINFNMITQDNNSFISNFINIISNLNEKGKFLFHFRINNKNKIVFFPIYIEILNGNLDRSNDYEKFNNFFNCNLLELIPLKISHFGLLLWKLPVKENSYNLSEFVQIFEKREDNIFFKLEENLIKKGLDFIKINNKMYLIKKKILFIIISNMNPMFIKKIIERYYKKYFILILFLHKEDYLNLKEEIKNINNLRFLKVMNKEEFKKLNYDFKNILITSH